MNQDEWERVTRIRTTVRGAVDRLSGIERMVIEEYYSEGTSLPHLAERESVTFRRIRLAHQRGLSCLRRELAEFVKEMFGIGAAMKKECPICKASWRTDAEAMLDEKTAEMTWGELIVRLERAVGWKAPSPQSLITHQRKHRTFEVIAMEDETDDAA